MSDEIIVKVNSYGSDRPLSLTTSIPFAGRRKPSRPAPAIGVRLSGWPGSWKRNCVRTVCFAQQDPLEGIHRPVQAGAVGGAIPVKPQVGGYGVQAGGSHLEPRSGRWR